MKSPKPFVLSLLAALLAGCVALPPGEPPAGAAAQPSADEAVEGAESGASASLDPDVVFNVLVGEGAVRQRDFPLAFVHLFRAALLSRDPALAEKAARLAMHADEGERAWEAAEFWVSLDPESMQARQLAVLYLMNQGRTDQALVHMREIISISERQGEDGFLHVMAALSRGKQHRISVQLMQELASGYP